MKRLVIIVLSCVLFQFLNSCALYNTVKQSATRAESYVAMKDGKEYVGSIIIPYGNSEAVNLKKYDGEKIMIANSDISYFDVWHRKHPDYRYTFRCLPYLAPKAFSKEMEMTDSYWMSLQAAGENVEFYCLGLVYLMTSDGVLTVQSAPNSDIVIIAKKKDEQSGTFLVASKYYKNYWRKALIEYFSDDPVLCWKLENKEIDPKDLQEIADQYSPSK